MHKQFIAGLFVAAAILMSAVGVAIAAPYGKGGYGSCTYKGCVAAPASTQAVLPGGLDVSINLVNGQAIPRNGYTVMVTPLNGQGASFKQVDFYLDGKLVFTAFPDGTGTARWDWNPGALPGTEIRVVITDVNGATITKTFKVTVGDEMAVTTASSPSAVPIEEPTGLSAVARSISNAAKRAIAALPRPIVYSFPYLLFVLLAGNVVLLLLQAKRELGEYRTLQRLLARAQALNQDKKTLMQLISHYLRTPLTVIKGGVEMMQQRQAASSSMVNLQAVTTRLQQKIEQVIGAVEAAEAGVVGGPPAVAGRVKPWCQPGLYLPVVLIGVLAFLFTYFTSRAANFSVTQVNLAVQVVIFAMVALASYQAFRRVQLHRRDVANIQAVVAQEAVTTQVRDKLMAETTIALNDDVRQLDAIVSNLGATPAVTFVQKGQSGLHGVLDKFAIAARLQGNQSTGALAPVRFGDVLERAWHGLQPKAALRGIRLQVSGQDTICYTRDEVLLTFVIRSVLDNAIAYSPDKGVVQVNLSDAPGGSIITITDSGPGIPASKQPELFKPFSRADGVEVFTHEGMGLSLYLDKLIMDYVGGHIDLQSVPGSTAVHIHLPASL